jgi:drug/metabolite transporter (DMT)-like permease
MHELCGCGVTLRYAAAGQSRQQFWKISLLALIFCLTVVLGNVSLKFIPVSFNQAIGATTPAFTAALALLR